MGTPQPLPPHRRPQIDTGLIGIMRTHYSEDGNLVEVDWLNPAVMAARAEPLHPDDGDDWDAELAPDLGETIDLNQIQAIPRNALKTLVRFLLPPPCSRGGRRWKVATARLAIVARMLDLDDLGALSLAELGEELGYTRALLSLRSLEIIDQLELNKDKLGKVRSSREVYRQAAIRSHIAQGHKMKAVEASHSISA